MSTIVSLLVIVALSLALGALVRLSYRLVDVRWGHPYGWMAVMFVLGFGFWTAASWAPWNVAVTFWASVLAAALNLSPGAGVGYSSSNVGSVDGEAEPRQASSKLQYLGGLVSYATACVLGWALYSGEICAGLDCEPLLGL